MTNRLATILLVIVIAGLSFYFGYHLGSVNAIQQLEFSPNVSKQMSNDSVIPTPNERSDNANNKTNKQLTINDTSTSDSNNETTNRQPNNRLEELRKNPNIIDILEYIESFSNDESGFNIRDAEILFDLLNTELDKSSDNVEILVAEYINNSDKAMSFLISDLLVTLDDRNQSSYVNDLVNQLRDIGTESADGKLLTLIFNTGLKDENPDILNTIKEIALYRETSDSNLLGASELLMPYHVNDQERAMLLSRLQRSLTSSQGDEQGYIVENIVRFTPKSQREEQIIEYLSGENPIETRLASVNSLHNRIVEPSENLKNILIKIATTQDDPMREPAIFALTEVFEISNAEYQQIQKPN